MNTGSKISIAYFVAAFDFENLEAYNNNKKEKSMKQSLFSYLTSYVPTDKRESREDYLTQMFAWILENVDDYAKKYSQFLMDRLSEKPVIEYDSIDISTQETLSSGRIDLLLKIDGRIGFICEHKVFSALSENQIQKYMNASSELGDERYYSVLVTFSKLQHTQDADVLLTWSDIYDFSKELLDSYEGVDAFVLCQFITYLKENGLGSVEPIKIEGILGYWAAKDLENVLTQYLQQLSTEPWEELVPGLHTFAANSSTYHPQFKKQRWGRVGIELFEKWLPGIFIGIIVDPSDHSLPPLDAQKGPDLVILLELNYSTKNDEARQTYNEFINSREYVNLVDHLEKSSGSFEFQPGIEQSKWRVAVLRKSMLDILKGTTSRIEQYEAIKATIIKGISMIVTNFSENG